MTFKEYYGEEACESIRGRLEDFFNSSKGGYLFIGNNEANRVTDAYMGICDFHVLDQIGTMLADALRQEHPGLVDHMKEQNHA